MEETKKEGRTLVIGDIHGCYKALMQTLDRAKYDPEVDILIQLGDIADGWPEVRHIVDFFTCGPVGKCIFIRGNHDEWAQNFLETGVMDSHHRSQGGQGTYDSYAKYYSLQALPQMHIDFFRDQANYHLDDKGRLFVHGGFNRHFTLEENDLAPYNYYWDRDLWLQAMSFKEIDTLVNGKQPKFKIKDPRIKEVFIGHTATNNWKNGDKPMNAACIWNLDTGAGWDGRLTIMDVDTKEYWQSDPVRELYPTSLGRGSYKRPLDWDLEGDLE